MRIKVSSVFYEIRSNPGFRGYALEGGSRSTKTWSIIQFLCLYCQLHKDEGKEITIARDRLTWLKLTVLRDFQEVLKGWGWWNDNDFNKTSNEYHLFGNRFTFVGLDEPAKLGGLKQHIFWLNEGIGTPGSAYNITKDDFDQLEQRTEEFFFIDYNPKVTKHWIYDSVLTRPDVRYIHSTMTNNPFLSANIRKKILSYEPTPENTKNGTADPMKWKIYGLGLRGQHEGVIFKNVAYVKYFPPDCSRVWYGLDFGFTNDVTALGKVGLKDGELYLEEKIYETGLTNPDISNRMIQAGLLQRDEIVADSAEAKSVVELQRMKWNVEGAQKGPDSVSFSIGVLMNYKINIVETSMNAKNEFDNYVWKEDPQTHQILNTPVDKYNHLIDGLRYVALNKLSQKQRRGLQINY